MNSSQTHASKKDDLGLGRCAPRETRSGPGAGEEVTAWLKVTVATGFDVDYYLDQVGADYYLTAAGSRRASGRARAPRPWACAARSAVTRPAPG